MARLGGPVKAQSSVVLPHGDRTITAVHKIDPMSTVTQLSSPPPPPPPPEVKAMSKDIVDQDYLIKTLAENIRSEDSKVILSIFDFGGQDVFNVIHAFFLTRFGVYIVVFNMECMTSKNPEEKQRCLNYLRFWVNSVIVHTSNELENGTIATAHIAFVGTHKDVVPNIVDHKNISSILFDNFHGSAVWPYIIDNKFPRETTNLVFFPVDNKLGRRDPVIQELMKAIEQVIDDSDYVHALKPLSWFRVMDEFNAMWKLAVFLCLLVMF